MTKEPGHGKNSITKRYGSEADVEALTGFSRKTLQKDRVLRRRRFPFYKVGGKVLYDLGEIESIIKASRTDIGPDRRRTRRTPSTSQP